jgi:hypothetical protein
MLSLNPIAVSCCTAGVLSCGWIAWQDFKDRYVHVILFIFLMLAGILMSVGRPLELVSHALINTALVVTLVLVVWLWIRVIRKLPVSQMMLGWGDIVMMEALAFWLPPVVFILFFTLSTWVILIVTLIYRKAKQRGADFPVPFAGGLAVLFIPVILYLYFCSLAGSPSWGILAE